MKLNKIGLNTLKVVPQCSYTNYYRGEKSRTTSLLLTQSVYQH